MRESVTLAIFTLLSATLIHGLENSSGNGKPVIGGGSQIPMNIPPPNLDPANTKLLELLNRQLSIRDLVNINVKMPRELKIKMLITFGMLRMYAKELKVQSTLEALLSIIQILPRSHHNSSNSPPQLQQPSNVVWGFPLPMIGGYSNAGLAGLSPAAGFPHAGLAGMPPFANVNHMFAPGSNNDQTNAAAFGDSTNDHFDENPKQNTFKPSNAADAPNLQNAAPEPEDVSQFPPPPPPASVPEPVPVPGLAPAPVNMPASVETPAPENTLSNVDVARRLITDMGPLTRAGLTFGKDQASAAAAAVAAAARRFQSNPFVRAQVTSPASAQRNAAQ